MAIFAGRLLHGGTGDHACVDHWTGGTTDQASASTFTPTSSQRFSTASSCHALKIGSVAPPSHERGGMTQSTSGHIVEPMAVADRVERGRASFERRMWGDAFAGLSAAHRESRPLECGQHRHWDEMTGLVEELEGVAAASLRGSTDVVGGERCRRNQADELDENRLQAAYARQGRHCPGRPNTWAGCRMSSSTASATMS